jgi:hypothetical protein
MSLTEPIQLVEESRFALQSLRRALIEMYDSVGADPSVPQDVSRRFDLNRNLTWKLARVIGAPDPLAALNHLPGQAGMELAIEAFERAGAPPAITESVRSAMSEFAAVVKEHAGDREQLELTLESMGMIEADAATISGRELAFRGNSSVWGVQARTRLTTMMVAPGKPGTHDYIMLSGLVGLRRLRPELDRDHFQTGRWKDWPLTQRECHPQLPQRAMEYCKRLVRVCKDTGHENREVKVKANYTISEE